VAAPKSRDSSRDGVRREGRVATEGKIAFGMPGRSKRERGNFARRDARRERRLLAIFERERAMGAFVVARRVLGDLPLNASQLAQLRAMDTRYWRRIAERDSTGTIEAALEAEIEVELRAMLTPEQRRSLEGK
jgi:hypothetical protein